MLRDQACPHCGWSAASNSKDQDPTTKIQRRSKHQAPNGPPLPANFWLLILGSSLELGCWRLDVESSIALKNRAQGLSRNIALFQNVKLVPPERLFRDLVIFDTQAEDRFALWIKNERIKIV